MIIPVGCSLNEKVAVMIRSSIDSEAMTGNNHCHILPPMGRSAARLCAGVASWNKLNKL